KKDFLHRMRITRKECKESGYWLRLLLDLRAVNEDESLRLLDESRQLRNIFSSIIAKNS
ncbi:MAG: four helix bundle protein, partial [Candidatus Omnitrophica bacterium]|nr:four helix bundle protein [Candidatus Omnitrophota bacterium]